MMHRGVLVDCLPWFLLLVGLVVALRLLLAVSGARWRARRLISLHQDEAGAVQSLSFVLTLPIFIMVLMLIVQASQLMIGQMVVEYASVAAARAAIVWIPAGVGVPGSMEWENCISSYTLDANQAGTNGGTRYFIAPGSPKYQRIQSAAIMACAPIAPSQAVAGQQAAPGNLVAAVQRAYAALAPASANTPAVPGRLANKLAYSQNNTTIQLGFVHKPEAPSTANEPPLATYGLLDDVGEFYFNEVGWQDSITVTVFHRLALLPGPGRLLFGRAVSPTGQVDQVAGQIQQVGNVYTYLLSATTTLGNEGEKPVEFVPYAYQP
jgi:Flp pilus assembly protein TadG